MSTGSDNSRSEQHFTDQGSDTSRAAWWRPLLSNWLFLISIGFVVLILLSVFVVAFVPAVDPRTVDPLNRLAGPSTSNWLGVDDLGRDVFARLIYGGRTSLIVGFSVTALAALIGATLGLISAYYPRMDTLIMRIMDGFMAFPSILLALAIMASLGPHTGNVIIALTVVFTPQVARLVRSSALANLQEPFVESARAIGCSDFRIIWKYVLMNSLSPLIVQCTFIVALAVIAEAALSFLGAGVPVETPTWGNMLRDGQRLITRAWWLAVFPGAALFLFVLSLNIIGDTLRDVLDPRLRT